MDIRSSHDTSATRQDKARGGGGGPPPPGSVGSKSVPAWTLRARVGTEQGNAYAVPRGHGVERVSSIPSWATDMNATRSPHGNLADTSLLRARVGTEQGRIHSIPAWATGQWHICSLPAWAPDRSESATVLPGLWRGLSLCARVGTRQGRIKWGLAWATRSAQPCGGVDTRASPVNPGALTLPEPLAGHALGSHFLPGFAAT